MDPEQVEAIIFAVEKRQCIYDKTSPEYSNRNYINNKWKKIAEKVGCRDDEVWKGWKKLQDYFQKTHRELTTTKSGAAGGKKRKWYLYDHMLFLLPYLIDRSTTTNVAPLSSDEDALDAENNMSQASTSSFPSAKQIDTPTPTPSPTLVPDETNNQDLPAACPVTSYSHSQPQQNARPRRPKLFPQHRAQQSEFESEMLRAAQRLGDRKVETDEDEYFFKNLIPKIKLLNTVEKMKCQAEIHMVVLKYVETASNSAVFQPEPGQQTPPNTSVNQYNSPRCPTRGQSTYSPQTTPQNTNVNQYNSPRRPTRGQSTYSPQTTYMQSPNQYEEYQYTTSQYQQH